MMRRWLAAKLLKLAEHLDPAYGFRWLSGHTWTYEAGQGIVFREDGRGVRLWFVEADKGRAWADADTEWDPIVDSNPHG